MNASEVNVAAREFLQVVLYAPVDRPPEATLRAALDRLAMASNYEAPFPDDRTWPEPEVHTYNDIRAIVGARFPDLGYYNIALEIGDHIGASELGLGDAIDDLVDITEELLAVVWRLEHTSPEDALWHFQFGFESHWGDHLRGLQLYLHRRAHG